MLIQSILLWVILVQACINRKVHTGKKAHTRKDINHKAIIVIEHLIQASDVVHTMHHWHIYCKWHVHLFQENKYKCSSNVASHKIAHWSLKSTNGVNIWLSIICWRKQLWWHYYCECWINFWRNQKLITNLLEQVFRLSEVSFIYLLLQASSCCKSSL